MPIIEVEHLTKEYRLGTLTSLKDNLTNALRRLVGRPPIERERFKALDDVSFTIEEGEVVGIIGHNGAGKSTLLKILAKVTTPTRGRVAVHGSVAPLIEVGAGINPELTGRENIFLNASILGIPKKVIHKKLDEIIEFSELEPFIDTPVKRYSSGMKVKLGFAIATSLDAEILIIDEVLAVGDLAFQRKCFDRMEELIKRQGKTVLLVSHNLRQIERLCSRTLCLNQGKIVFDGPTREACNFFFEENDKKIMQQVMARGRWESSNDIELLSCELQDDHGNPITSIESGSDAIFSIKYKCLKPINYLTIVFGIHTTDFVFVGSKTSSRNDVPEKLSPGIYESKIKLKELPLSVGSYAVRIAFDIENPVRNAFYADNVTHFKVVHKHIKRGDIDNEGLIVLDGEWLTFNPISRETISDSNLELQKTSIA